MRIQSHCLNMNVSIARFAFGWKMSLCTLTKNFSQIYFDYCSTNWLSCTPIPFQLILFAMLVDALQLLIYHAVCVKRLQQPCTGYPLCDMKNVIYTGRFYKCKSIAVTNCGHVHATVCICCGFRCYVIH